MQVKPNIVRIIAAGPAVLGVPSHADTCIWLGQSASWCDARNWSCGRVPGANDDVVIPVDAPAATSEPGIDCDTTINSLTVCAGREVVFLGPYTLTIDDGPMHVKAGGAVDINWQTAAVVLGGTDALDIDGGQAGMTSSSGTVRINASGAVLRLSGASSGGNAVDGELLLLNGSGKLDITADVTMRGSGSIRGSNSGAQIAIASGITLTSTMCAASGGIRGAMRIGGAGTFIAHGQVEADGGTLELESGLAAVNDDGNAVWVVGDATGSRLLLSRSATGLEGDFVAANAIVLGEDVDIWTCGELTYNAGSTIDVDTANSKSFRYKYFNESSDCANPYDTTANGCGGTVFVVTGDHLIPCS